MKNESWILAHTLSALSEIVDEIIILDDGSNDNSVEIVKSFQKVTKIIEKGPQKPLDRNEPKDWNVLTQEAIKRNADWIWYTDADEMIEPSIKTKIQNMLQDNLVGMYRFRKISPWKGLKYYRKDQKRFDNKAEFTLNPIIVRVTPELFWDNPKGSLWKRVAKKIIRGENFRPIFGRVFPRGVKGKIVNIDDTVSIHFNHIDYEKIIKKQIFYAVNEKSERPYKDNNQIVEWAFKGITEKDMELVEMDQKWLWQDYIHLIQYRKSNGFD